MVTAVLTILGGFALLIWSAGKFVGGASATASHAGMPPLLIGMLIVGFGTSAPEMLVSAIAALEGNPALALGNAIGSNTVNIGLILGVTAVVAPMTVASRVLHRELPLLLGISVLAGLLLWDGMLTQGEAGALLATFFALVVWTVSAALRNREDLLGAEVDQELELHAMSLRAAVFWLVSGLLLLIVSSRLLVRGSVTIAHALGVSDLVIGLTVVALGTSLPELAASVVAARKGEHDIAIGNLIGSNMFNLLTVVGIAGLIAPMNSVAPEVVSRDWPVMMGLTTALFVMAYGFRGHGRINRLEGLLLVLTYGLYNLWLVYAVVDTG